MTMKSRLRRLLGGKSRFRKDTYDEDVPEAEVASTSSGIVSHDDNEFSYYGSPEDPFADVRERLEELSALDRARFADHTIAHKHQEEGIPSFIAYTCYLAYAILIFIGHLRNAVSIVLHRGRYVRQGKTFPSDNHKLFAPILKSWEHFYTRRLYHRIQDCFNRPIASNPGAHIHVLERVSDDGQKSMKVLESLESIPNLQQREEYSKGEYFVQEKDGRVSRNCLNLGSYNYLGFADDWHQTCAKSVKGCMNDFPVSSTSCRNEYGTTVLHRQVEKTIAEFCGKEDALCLNMGFNTNASTIPALVGRGDLLISDELNHTSIVNGARASGAAIRTFRHNDMEHLEEIIREAIVMGRPRTRRPWNKILVIVEGIYSMEGEYCDLRNVVRICKKYGAYVYLDEAHSIGAMGPTGRGLAEYAGVDTADIDIMMGTFTKSFGGMGGYIAASKDVISYLRRRCAGSSAHNSLSPVVCQQVITSFKVRISLLYRKCSRIEYTSTLFHLLT
jgi:serine palmitoyltransferase